MSLSSIAASASCSFLRKSKPPPFPFFPNIITGASSNMILMCEKCINPFPIQQHDPRLAWLESFTTGRAIQRSRWRHACGPLFPICFELYLMDTCIILCFNGAYASWMNLVRTIMSVFSNSWKSSFFFCGVILGICSTQMVPRYAFTINSMDYGQSIMLGLKVLKWMFAP